MDELGCTYAGSYGLLKSTTHRSPVPYSDYPILDPSWYAGLYDGAVLHVCSSALPVFVEHVLPTISVKFKLLTNNSDATLPDDYSVECTAILNHPNLIHWFSQNWVGTHPNVTQIPIGLDYHSMRPIKTAALNAVRMPQPNKMGWGANKEPRAQEHDLLRIQRSAPAFWQREVKAYANFQFMMWTRYGKDDRKRALDVVPKHLVYYEPVKAPRDVCWSNMARHAFVLSPQGNGLDCHRTWEALCLGCIPIVKSSGLNSLFDGLPVWIVGDWTEVTEASMRSKIEEFRPRQFAYEKLTLSYWQSKIAA
jgi:hypothetical protein